ncbi:MAG TPA: sigma factor-like helix-turn-helix DNA-binding protein, partial [Urbifossiella sp.]|nr:sigma factor-like helix-turn-helix DNA-binding protein [Urbifossiella sp.]
YATWAVLRAFGRTVPAAAARHRLFRSGADEALAAWPDERPAEAEQVAGAAAARERVAELLARLDSRTRAVVRMRAGLDGEQTSVRIGEHFGVSPERVRQIYLRGLNRLRELAGSVAGA